MRFEETHKKLAEKYGPEIFHQSTYPELHTFIYDMVRKTKPSAVLELGFRHGISSCFIGAALHENQKGHLITMDRKETLEKFTPTIYETLSCTSLENHVTPIFAELSYNWELMKLIEKNTIKGVCDPMFDFCLIDGAHMWETDGFAFFLVAKLLKGGGWIVLDDLQWTINTSSSIKDAPWTQSIPEEQKITSQIQKVFELLVKQHPLFRNFSTHIRGNVAVAQKLAD